MTKKFDILFLLNFAIFFALRKIDVTLAISLKKKCTRSLINAFNYKFVNTGSLSPNELKIALGSKRPPSFIVVCEVKVRKMSN